MPQHEFGIMTENPKPGVEYNDYTPHRYNCISIDDTFIEPIVDKLLSVDCDWHTLDNRKNGLAYCGITLIPPMSCQNICCMLDDNNHYQQLKNVLTEAYKTGKYVIHFGI